MESFIIPLYVIVENVLGEHSITDSALIELLHILVDVLLYDFNQVVLTGLKVLDLIDHNIMVEVTYLDGEYIDVKLFT
jgi:hypothetical protein